MNVIDKTMIEDNISLFKPGFVLNKEFDKEYDEIKQKVAQIRRIKIKEED